MDMFLGVHVVHGGKAGFMKHGLHAISVEC